MAQILCDESVSALGSNTVAHYDAQHLCTAGSFSSATVYYPSTGGSSLPSVVLVGGWLCGEQVLAAWAPFFASHGIVAMTIGTPFPHRDMPSARSRALLDGSKALQKENSRRDSKLFGRLDTSRRAVMGYSLGGGGAQLAALDDPTLKCAIALAPHSGDTSSFPANLTPSVPMLFIVGDADKDAPARDFSWPHYNATGAPKLFFEITGGDHFIVTGPSGGNGKDFEKGRELEFCCNWMCAMCCGCAPCPSGFGTGPSGLAEDNASHGAIGGVALAWLQLFLQGDESARSRLLQRPGIASRFESKGIDSEEMQR